MPETLDLLDEDLLHIGVPQLDLELEHLMSLARLGCLPTEVEDYARCSDEQLASILGIIAEHDRMVAGHKALVAGLIAERSRPNSDSAGSPRARGIGRRRSSCGRRWARAHPRRSERSHSGEW